MSVEMLNQYVVRLSTAPELPPGYQYLEYRNERYGVLPKRGCSDCHGHGLITRNGAESKCDCLWRRMFDARHSSSKSAPAFVASSPGMVAELRKRRDVLQKQLDAAHAHVAGTQGSMDEELKRHDAVVEQAAQLAEQADEAHRTVQADIEHLEKSVEYNKGRADELRAQARELENQNERDRVTLGKRRSHDLHQASLERDRARKKIEKLQEERTKISHRWYKQLRDPQREVRKAEERVTKIDRQIAHLDVADLTDAPPPTAPTPPPPSIDPFLARGLTVPASPLTAPPPVTVTPEAMPPAEVNRNPATDAVLVDSLAAMLAGELPAAPRPADEIPSPAPAAPAAPATVVVPAEVALAALRASLGIPDDFATGPTTAVEAALRAEIAKPPAAAQEVLREVAQGVADTVAEAHGLPPVTVTVPKSE